MASRRVAFSGNTSLIATLSSLLIDFWSSTGWLILAMLKNGC